MQNAFEVNIDTLVGPTHQYAGLAIGNIASETFKFTKSNPKKAALQGLEKMKIVSDLGIKQLIFPPQLRPDFHFLSSLGFTGKDHEIIEKALRENVFFVLQATSSSFMWTANSAIASPSSDTFDHKVHFTCANLLSNTHRSIETKNWQRLFKSIFNNSDLFVHHPPVWASSDFFDEGAANHTRFCTHQGTQGVHLFVYGRSATTLESSKKYPARQTLEAQLVIAKTHGLKHVLFAQQNPHTIDKGVFHNDVIASGHELLFLVHEKAYKDPESIQKLQNISSDVLKKKLDVVLVKEKDLSVQQAVSSYLFNSQILTAKNRRVILAPKECESIPFCQNTLKSLADSVVYLPLDQSMHNGGGPACLRLRVVLTENEFNAIHKGVIFNEELYLRLKQLIEEQYPDSFSLQDLKDPLFLQKIQECQERMYHIVELSGLLRIS